MRKLRSRAAISLILAAALLAGLAFYVVRYLRHGRDWALSPVDAAYYSQGRLCVGTLTDRNGVVLASTSDGKRSYAEDAQTRVSCLHAVGDQEGYIGAGALRLFTDELSGYDLVQGAYGDSDTGAVVALSLDAKLQNAAYAALAGRNGAVALCDYRTGAMLCMVSSPSYDPLAGPSADAEGVYVNRVTGSTYTPGSVFKIVTLCAALEQIDDIRSRSFFCTGEKEIGGLPVKCSGIHGAQDIGQAFANSCNCAFAELSLELGAETLSAYAARLGLTQPLSVCGAPVAPGSFEKAASGSADLAWSGIGQYTDLVSPFAMLRLSAAIAGGGTVREPTLLKGGKIEKSDVISAATAKALSDMMRNNVTSNYGDWIAPGLQLCAKTGTAELGDGTSHAWFTGFLLDEAHPYAFVVILEHGGGGLSAAAPVASALINAAVNG
ncbi:MAG: penicillin-binding protein [Oscillospiraceae bacterium]|nr:penicillin-binding protein [Oscillospiraceae bacterium]